MPVKELSAPAGSPWQHSETGSQLCLPALMHRCQVYGDRCAFLHLLNEIVHGPASSVWQQWSTAHRLSNII